MAKGVLLHCSFCGRSRRRSRKLVAGDGVYICHRCVDEAGSRPDVSDPGRACSFCGRRRPAVDRMTAEGSTAICDECLRRCVEIIDEELAR